MELIPCPGTKPPKPPKPKKKHIAEPWFMEGGTIRGNVRKLSKTGKREASDLVAILQANSHKLDGERIVACVNACKDIEAPEVMIPKLLAYYGKKSRTYEAIIPCDG